MTGWPLRRGACTGMRRSSLEAWPHACRIGFGARCSQTVARLHVSLLRRFQPKVRPLRPAFALKHCGGLEEQLAGLQHWQRQAPALHMTRATRLEHRTRPGEAGEYVEIILEADVVDMLLKWLTWPLGL